MKIVPFKARRIGGAAGTQDVKDCIGYNFGRSIRVAGWTTFLRNHADGIVAMDLFVVPAISFRLLYGLLILRHDRRRIFGRIASRIRPDLIFGRHRFKVPNLSYSQKVRRAELFERPRNGQIIDPQGATCDRGRPTAVVYPNFVETDFFEYP